MGSDMYAYIEYKPLPPFPSGEYDLFAKVQIDREYGLFALVGGKTYSDVIEPLYDFRGLPKDMSEALKWIHEEDGGTSIASWLNLLELRNVQQRYEELIVNDQSGYEAKL